MFQILPNRNNVSRLIYKTVIQEPTGTAQEDVWPEYEATTHVEEEYWIVLSYDQPEIVQSQQSFVI